MTYAVSSSLPMTTDHGSAPTASVAVFLIGVVASPNFNAKTLTVPAVRFAATAMVSSCVIAIALPFVDVVRVGGGPASASVGASVGGASVVVVSFGASTPESVVESFAESVVESTLPLSVEVSAPVPVSSDVDSSLLPPHPAATSADAARSVASRLLCIFWASP